MLQKLKFTVSFLAVLAIAIFIAYSAKDLAEPITLSIPSCDIEVECEYVVNPTSERLQSSIDKLDIAAWCNNFIFDHASQDFEGLWNMKYGDEAVFGTKHYRYVFTVKGFSDNGIYVKDGLLPKADLYLCTCVPGGEPYEIYIVGLVKQ